MENRKPFDIEWCPNCRHDGIRDCGEIELVEGEQEIKQNCETCGWEADYIYEVKFIRVSAEKM